MQSNVNPQLVLSDHLIWRTPHIVQRVRRGELQWDELLRIFVQDLALGVPQEQWIARLLREGNVGLACELARQLGLETVMNTDIQADKNEWQQMVEVAKADAVGYITEQADEIQENERERYEELTSVADEYMREDACGDAVATLELALQSIKSAVERRREAAAKTFSTVEARLSKARTIFAATKASKFPGGPTEYDRARRLLLKADERLYSKDYPAAEEIVQWVESMCEGRPFPSETVEKLLGSPIALEPAVKELELSPEVESLPAEPTEELGFERDWSQEDDEYLIDNYDLMSNGQLKLRFYTTDQEIERRIEYLGLMHDRDKGRHARWRNPYVAGKPIRTKRVFVGRDDVFSFVGENLRIEADSDRNLIVLLGHRRTGKTSILLQLLKNRRDILEPRIPVFIDMDRLLPFPGGLKNFFWKIACCIREELEEREAITLPEPTEEEFTDPSWRFQEFLHKVERAVGNRGLVLMLDEFQAIEPRLSGLDVDVYKMLRTLIQHDTQLDFILCGTMRMEKLMRDYEAAMFGSAIIKKIDFLDEQDARKLVVAPVQGYITYSKEAVDLVVEATASHPYFVQLVCWTLVQYLIDRGKSKVSVHDVERILPKALEHGVHFDEIWATETTNLEQYIMAVVGELAPARGSWCAVTKIEKRLKEEQQMPEKPDELDEAITNLTNRRILRRSPDGSALRFQVDVFGQWVRANKPFEVVRRDIRAEAATLRKRIERLPKTTTRGNI